MSPSTLVNHVAVGDRKKPFGLFTGVDRRIPCLDGLRGVASFMVVAYHFGPHIVRDGGPFSFLHAVPPLWFQGVDLFFVLSGFLISGILVEARHSPRYFSVFYARRACRIFPLYYIVLLSYVVAVGVFGSQREQMGRLFENPLPIWPYAVYVQNFVMASANSYGPIWMAASWSLAVEEQFYLALPVLVKRVSDRTLGSASFGAIVAAPILRGLVQKFQFVPGLSNYVLLPMHVDALAVGIVVMLLCRHCMPWVLAYRRRIARGALVLFLGWTAYPYVPNPQAIRLAFIGTTMNAIVFGSVLLSLLSLPASPLAQLLSRRWIRAIGNMSYGTYLIHPILLCVLFRVMTHRDPSLDTIADLAPIATAFTATFVIAWLSWSQFESRLIGLGHRYRY